MNISSVRNCKVLGGYKDKSYVHLFSRRTAAKSVFIPLTYVPNNIV